MTMRCWIIAMGCALPLAASGTDAAVALAWQALHDAARDDCRSDAECRTLGVGAMACGGPQQYLPWSAAATHEPTLQAAARRYASARRKQIERTGESSVCVVLEDPGAACQPADETTAGRCVLRPPRAEGLLR